MGEGFEPLPVFNYFNFKIMKTTITKVFQVQEPIQKVWTNLTTPEEIVTCLPGAKLTEKVDDKNYKGEVTLKFGPIKAQYTGLVTFTEMNQENYTMILNGKGLDSKGKGSADMVMNGSLIEKDGGTEVTFSKEITIMGMLAQFGSRLINDVTDHVLDQFIANFKDKLKGQEVDNSMDAGSVMGAVVKNKLGGIFGGGKKEDA